MESTQEQSGTEQAVVRAGLLMWEVPKPLLRWKNMLGPF